MAAKKPASKPASKTPSKKPGQKSNSGAGKTGSRLTVKKSAKKPATPKKPAPDSSTKPRGAAASRKTTAKKPAGKKKSTRKTSTRKTSTSKTTAQKPTTSKTGSGRQNSKKTTMSTTTKKTAAATTKRVAATKTSRSGPKRESEGKQKLDVGYEDRKLAYWKGARWDKEEKIWYWPGPGPVPESLQDYLPAPYSWEQFRSSQKNKTTKNKINVTPYKHQLEAIQRIEKAFKQKKAGFLLADDVGLGKTITTILAIEQTNRDKNVLILCPLSVKAHWQLTLETLNADKNKYCIINYDSAKKLLNPPASTADAKKTKTKNRQTARAGISKILWDVVVCDESHLLKNSQSLRTHIVQRLRRTGPGRRTKAAFTLWLSATAGQNPLELSYLTDLIAPEVKTEEDYLYWLKEQNIQIKKGRWGNWAWEQNQQDLQTINKLLFEQNNAIRRKPQDIAGWPEQQRILWPCPLDRKQSVQYEQSWEEFLLLWQTAKTKTGKPKTQASANALAALTRHRQKASLLRGQTTLNKTVELLDNGHQVAISVQFLQTANWLQGKLEELKIGVSVIHGQLNAETREEQRVAFQRGETQVVIFTVTEGISLHAGQTESGGNTVPRTLLMHDPRWSGIQTVQIEGRTHRNGQAALAYHLYAQDTVEQNVVQATLNRVAAMGTLLGDDTDSLQNLLDQLVG